MDPAAVRGPRAPPAPPLDPSVCMSLEDIYPKHANELAAWWLETCCGKQPVGSPTPRLLCVRIAILKVFSHLSYTKA